MPIKGKNSYSFTELRGKPGLSRCTCRTLVVSNELCSNILMREIPPLEDFQLSPEVDTASAALLSRARQAQMSDLTRLNSRYSASAIATILSQAVANNAQLLLDKVPWKPTWVMRPWVSIDSDDEVDTHRLRLPNACFTSLPARSREALVNEAFATLRDFYNEQYKKFLSPKDAEEYERYLKVQRRFEQLTKFYNAVIDDIYAQR